MKEIIEHELIDLLLTVIDDDDDVCDVYDDDLFPY